jgi:hypothetical protein
MCSLILDGRHGSRTDSMRGFIARARQFVATREQRLLCERLFFSDHDVSRFNLWSNGKRANDLWLL